MDPRQHYRNIHGSVLTTLRSLDPLGHIAKYEGERAESHAYIYEATTILERLRQQRTPDAVEKLLIELGGNGASIDHRRLKEASGQVAEALARL